MTFNDLNLTQPILKAVEDEGYTSPTPIQQKAIPIALQGKDLLACAQTGTGKTASFSIPILELLEKRKPAADQKKQIRALILTPTRELAIQVANSFAVYGKYTDIKSAVIYGGVKQKKQTNQLGEGVDVLIATPGRLLDLVKQKFIQLKSVEILVLDEADRMLDMGFIVDVTKLVRMTPAKRQTMLFSATIPPDILGLANYILRNPESVDTTVASTTVPTIHQSVCYVEHLNKFDYLIHYMLKDDSDSTLIFTRTKIDADKLTRLLRKNKIDASVIHGDKSQSERQTVLENFKSGKSKILVATDIAARGLDVDNLSQVINFDIPDIAETYVHRIGRTGRAGAEGKALSLCSSEEYNDWMKIQKLIGQEIEVIRTHDFTERPESEIRRELRSVSDPSRSRNQGRNTMGRPPRKNQLTK